MNDNVLIKELQELAQVDIDTFHTYNRVLDEISDRVMNARLAEFRDDHVRHISDIFEEIQNLGGKPPKLTRDFKGYVIEAFAVLGTAVDMKSALKALKTAESIAQRYYGEIVPKDLPPELKKRLRKHLSDEKIHFEYIDNNLKVL